MSVFEKFHSKEKPCFENCVLIESFFPNMDIKTNVCYDASKDFAAFE